MEYESDSGLLVAGALGTPKKIEEKKMKTIVIETKNNELQKPVLIFTSQILRKVLEVWGVLLTPYLKNKKYLLVETNVRPYSNKNDYNNNNNNKNIKDLQKELNGKQRNLE